MTAPAAGPAPRGVPVPGAVQGRIAYYGLAIVTLLNFLNYVDRYVLVAVIPRLKRDLGISDFQVGLIGDAFLITYFVTSPLFGRLGDRRRRPTLIAIGVAVWSAATAAAGFARNFVQVMTARAAVGVGEAAYGTIAPSVRLVAPVTTVFCAAAPYSTVASSSLSAFGCLASFSTRAVRILSSHHGRSTPFTSVLDMWSFKASSSIGTVMSTYSRNHDTGTLISTRFPPREEAAC